MERVLPIWHEEIAPQLKSGKNVIIAAHGNSLRALVKYLDNIPENEITELNIPTGVPLIYNFKSLNLEPVESSNAIKPLNGEYLGDLEEIKNRILGVKNQTQGK